MSDICERGLDELTSVMTPVEEYSDMEEVEYSSDSGRDFSDDITIYNCATCNKPVCQKMVTGCGNTSEGHKLHSCIKCPCCDNYYCSLKHMKPKIVNCRNDKNINILCNEYLNTVNDNETFEEDCGPYQKSSFNEFGKFIEREFDIDLGIEEHERNAEKYSDGSYYVYNILCEHIRCINCINQK